jgi:uncharacterized protein (AIM24 family)
MHTYNPTNLPKNDNLSRFAFVVDVEREMYLRKGKMIAYYGQLQFNALGKNLLDMLARHTFNAPAFIEHFIMANGNGQLILGDNGNDIACYDIDDANLTVKASHLLGFSRDVMCQESTMPGYLTLLGTGKVIASSNGPVHFMEPPCRVDEQAILGWADCPSPSVRYDYEHVRSVVSMVGAVTGITLSGEERQIDFSGKGTVLVQSSELGVSGGQALAQLQAQLSNLSKSELIELQSTLMLQLKR